MRKLIVINITYINNCLIMNKIMNEFSFLENSPNIYNLGMLKYYFFILIIQI